MEESLKSTEKNLDETVILVQKMKTHLQKRTADYEKLAKSSETEKTRYQELASQERERAEQLSKQLASLQSKAQTAKVQAAKVQKEVEKRPGRLFRDKLKDGSEGPKMIVLAAGSFLMGSPMTEMGRYKHEGPQRRVTISEPFTLSTHEITFAEYDAFAKAKGRQLPNDDGWGRGDRPVINVSWKNATAYAAWLSEQTGQHYRLPTEAEWEYAARAGSTTAYSFGNDPSRLGGYVWYKVNSDSKTRSVGKKKPNDWGLYDISGNVWEWVEDWYGPYPFGPIADPTGPVEGKYRVIRGGSWNNDERGLRLAYRSRYDPDNSAYNIGFRVARDL